jgi:hypothetical protein
MFIASSLALLGALRTRLNQMMRENGNGGSLLFWLFWLCSLLLLDYLLLDGFKREFREQERRRFRRAAGADWCSCLF